MLNQLNGAILAFCLLVPQVAFSQSKDEIVAACLRDLSSGDVAAASVKADEIKSWTNLFNRTLTKGGAECLTGTIGEPWVYSEIDRQFRNEAEAKAERLAAYEAQLAESRAAQALEQAVARQQRDFERNAARVAQLSQEACEELFGSDQIAAMTNAVCVESFIRFGLPK